MNWRDIITQGIGFVGVLLFLLSYQVSSNRKLFILQTFGCLAFCTQFLLLEAYSGCLSLLINIVRNLLLTRYKSSALVRWKGWVLIFSLAAAAAAVLTWTAWYSALPVIGTIAGTYAYWTNNAKHIRTANLFANAPCMLVYDVLVKSWGGVLNEGITIASIVVSIIRFGWSALDGDTIESK